MKFKNIWWLLLLRGILFILFGIFAIGWPALTFVTLAFVFALYIIFSGVFNLIYGIIGIHHTHRYWFLLIIIGIFEIGIGTFAFNHPFINVAALALLIGFTLVVRGIFETISAFDDVYESSHKVLFAIGGILGLIAGIIILRYPIAGGIAFAWVLGVYALVTGSILVGLSMTVKDIFDNSSRTFSVNGGKQSARK